MLRILVTAGLLATIATAARAETVRLYAAGSLKAAMTDIARDFEASTPGGHKVEFVFGASGLLRERIEKGEAAHVFASADMGHPKRLAEQGRTSAPPSVFARNQLCAIARAGLAVGPATLLDVMLDPAVRLATSTPKADPSGDYAFALFAKAEALKAGARATLEAKALQLVGGPTSPQPPAGKSAYGWLMGEGKADLFLTYCTNAIVARTEVAGLQVVDIPAALAVGADYGLVVLKGAPGPAVDLATFVRSAKGRAVLARHGFTAGD